MLKNFRAYQVSVQFYKKCQNVRGPRHLQDQLLRASSSIALNLAEGSEGVTIPNRRQFYNIAFASLRECQAILDLLLTSEENEKIREQADTLGAILFKLCKSLEAKPSAPKNPEGTEA